jgi:hypothetical protein
MVQMNPPHAEFKHEYDLIITSEAYLLKLTHKCVSELHQLNEYVINSPSNIPGNCTGVIHDSL